MNAPNTFQHSRPTPEAFKILRDSTAWGDILSFSFITQPDKDYGAGMSATLKTLKHRTMS